MPQEIRVVQCRHCEMFQVDIVKQSNKWQCKMCDAKQDLRRELFRGSGAECRQKVQELNMKKGECEAQKKDAILDRLSERDGDVYVVTGMSPEDVFNKYGMGN